MKKAAQPIATGLLVVLPLLNTAFLPEGLYFTTLLTPFLFIALIRMGGLSAFAGCCLLSLLPIVFQTGAVTHWKDYLISFVVLQSIFIFIIAFYLFVSANPGLGNIFAGTATLNLLLLVLALITVIFTWSRPIMWYNKIISPGIPQLPRLKMFHYEPSYYSLSIVPLIAYYGLKKLLYQERHFLLLLTLILSLLLSFSLGVIGGLLLAAMLSAVWRPRSLSRRMNWPFLFKVLLAAISIVGLLFVFYRHNPLFERLYNIYTGKDTSARGRTYESFYICWEVIKMKSVVWGLGPGQFKYVGRDFLDYYYVLAKTPVVARIPNAVAETLCIYGLFGLCIRFILIFVFFFRTRVWQNYFRLFLFLFIFIYPFTGSYLFNPLEYAIWALAFCPMLFPQFNVVAASKKKRYESSIH